MKKKLNEEVILYNADNIKILKTFPDESIDMVLTSPPYDNLRKYSLKNKKDIEKLWNFNKFKLIAKELTRILKPGGIIVWVIGDATIKGSETLSSFKQAIYFKEECGLNVHDTMIYKKKNPIPLNHNRYEPCFEYMFVFSKGKPKTFNPIKVPTKNPGKKTKRYSAKTKEQAMRGRQEITVAKKEKIKENIWEYVSGNRKIKTRHPAVFPYELAYDHIISWSNEGDTVLDPFMGSGTTGIACIETNRKFIGIEISEEYFNETVKTFTKYVKNKK